MGFGKVEKYYRQKLESDGAMLFSLIDPDKCFLENAQKIAKQSYEGGADVILVGGSIGAQGSVLDETVKMIKEAVPLPIVLFPGNISGITTYADAIYFMSLLNSRDVYWMSTAQIQAAPVVERTRIDVIPTTYVIIEPGEAVGWIGNANLVPRERPDLAYACGLAAKYMGAHILITDSGSGAPLPAPFKLISAFAKACAQDTMYFYGGGVRTPEQATEVIKAGAMGIQVGAAFEEEKTLEKVKKISEAIKKEGKKRV
ncbi:geranylgeranylglyceryl/heptaprenylglyceryl phosphate synthase [Candidatus Micrarchaeota archaeon]|nr:geranylgeranylglyceryl/heptaprenylglyceryl phosphate synthase [Candidatus Micrarchaeota archaeon]